MRTHTTTPKWLRRYLSAKDLSEVSQAITKAELRTTGEIVIGLIPRCHHYGQTTLLMLAAGIAGFAIWLLVGGDRFSLWPEHEELSRALVAGVFVGLAGLAAAVPPLRRYMIGRCELTRQTHLRAELEFYRLGINATRAQTGILIFISFFEHRVIVLADRAINAKLPPNETWERIVQVILQSIQENNLKDGLLRAVTMAQSVLSEHFPANRHDNPNELPDYLLIYND